MRILILVHSKMLLALHSSQPLFTANPSSLVPTPISPPPNDLFATMTYPRMEKDDIIGALNGWQLSVNEIQLTRPTPDFVRNIYRSCLEHITAINEEPIQSAVTDAFVDTGIDETVCG